MGLWTSARQRQPRAFIPANFHSLSWKIVYFQLISKEKRISEKILLAGCCYGVYLVAGWPKDVQTLLVFCFHWTHSLLSPTASQISPGTIFCMTCPHGVTSSTFPPAHSWHSLELSFELFPFESSSFSSLPDTIFAVVERITKYSKRNQKDKWNSLRMGMVFCKISQEQNILCIPSLLSGNREKLLPCVKKLLGSGSKVSRKPHYYSLIKGVQMHLASFQSSVT